MRRVVAAIATGWALLSAGHAQTQTPTLASALEQAWAHAPQAQAFSAWEQEAQARDELAAGLTPAPPSLSLSNASDRLNAATGKDAWELELATPIWLPGQRTAQRSQAQSALADVAARRTALRLQLAAEVRAAWWALAQARNALDLATRRQASASALQADVQRRFKAGELARIDANLADLEQLAAQDAVLQAQAEVDLAEQAFHTLTGSAAPAQLPEEAAAPEPSTATASHPLLQAAQAQVQLAQAHVAAAQQTTRDAPEIALRWGRERGDASTAYADSVGIKLTVPFGAPARLRQETSSALAQAAQADAELVRTQQRLALDLARAQREAHTAQRQLDQAQTRVDLTQDTLRLSEKSFALGEMDLPSLLRARAAALDAQAHLAQQRIARAASVSRLKQSMGVLP